MAEMLQLLVPSGGIKPKSSKCCHRKPKKIKPNAGATAGVAKTDGNSTPSGRHNSHKPTTSGSFSHHTVTQLSKLPLVPQLQLSTNPPRW